MAFTVKASDLIDLKSADNSKRRAAFGAISRHVADGWTMAAGALGPPFSRLDVRKAEQPTSFTTRLATAYLAEMYAKLGTGGVTITFGAYAKASEYAGAPYLYVRVRLEPVTRWTKGVFTKHKTLIEEIQKLCDSADGWHELYQKRNKEPTIESAHRFTCGKTLCIADGSWQDQEIGEDQFGELMAKAAPLCRDCAQDHLDYHRGQYVRLLEGTPPPNVNGGAGTGLLLERSVVVESLAVAMCTRKLVLLAGVSGSGKTQLACHLAGARGLPQVISAVANGDAVTPLSARLRQGLLAENLLVEDSDGWVCMRPPSMPDESETVANDDESSAVASPQAIVEAEVKDPGPDDDEGDDDQAEDDDDDAVVEGGEPAAPAPARRSWDLVPVRPDWQEAASLWGWREKECFHGTPALRLVLDAWNRWLSSAPKRDERVPVSHVLILDEMNLSRIEHYGSDLLSAMERPGEAIIRLHDAGKDLPLAGSPRVVVPDRIGWAPGLCVVGTVNVDETTFSFAPKVLDRACVLEFLDVDLNRAFRIRQRSAEWTALQAWFTAVQEILRPHALHLGYRAAFEIADLAKARLGEDPTSWDGVAALDGFLDEMLRNKVLPRVRGSRAQVEPVLLDLAALAMAGLESDARATEREKIAAMETGKMREALTTARAGKYPEAAVKCLTMLERVDGTGFASFF